MAFAGKYQLESQLNFNEFMEETGLKKADTDHKVVTEIIQDGDNFTWTNSIPGWSWTIKFTLGQECEMESMKGIHFKGTPTMKDGKLALQLPEYHFTAEIIDDKLVVVCVAPGEKGVTLKRVSARI